MKRIFSLAGLIALPGIASALDLSGDWKIHSSVGGTTPIVVNCTPAPFTAARTSTATR